MMCARRCGAGRWCPWGGAGHPVHRSPAPAVPEAGRCVTTVGMLPSPCGSRGPSQHTDTLGPHSQLCFRHHYFTKTLVQDTQTYVGVKIVKTVAINLLTSIDLC
ncbi:hypothetical protein E2C01_054442 [Portunus trituberculatus]|uniref:Uncharacterized protein n=1 Tax=Portunus trituberculatus TaxID=210409 RepID=A0A5B7GTP5_PORTR|nr:hypothetical protein [Portunus trituberculatus]